MKAEDVLAIVVSYNGLQKTKQTVEALRPQVGHVHIVDNGSGGETLAVLESLEREARITVERLGENRGVGHALNLGVERARRMGCSWLLTMDQDSLVGDSMINAFRAAVARDPALVCLAPIIVSDHGATRQKDRGVVAYAITSGNLVRVSLFDQIGLYDESFFVDCIDFDFSLRVRRAGHGVVRVPDALMRHQLGEAVEAPGFVTRFYAQHSPIRRYYMYRNYMYLTERYILGFPVFIVKLGILHVLLLLLIAFLDKSPLKSYRAIARGLWDYLTRKAGPYAERAR
jgi:rhamnosyltransferase